MRNRYTGIKTNKVYYFEQNLVSISIFPVSNFSQKLEHVEPISIFNSRFTQSWQMSDFCFTVFFVMTTSHRSSLNSASKTSDETDEPMRPTLSHPQHSLTTLTVQRNPSNPHHDLCITAMTNACMILWKQGRKRLSQHCALLFKHPLLLRGQCPFFEPPNQSGK